MERRLVSRFLTIIFSHYLSLISNLRVKSEGVEKWKGEGRKSGKVKEEKVTKTALNLSGSLLESMYTED